MITEIPSRSFGKEYTHLRSLIKLTVNTFRFRFVLNMILFSKPLARQICALSSCFGIMPEQGLSKQLPVWLAENVPLHCLWAELKGGYEVNKYKVKINSHPVQTNHLPQSIVSGPGSVVPNKVLQISHYHASLRLTLQRLSCFEVLNIKNAKMTQVLSCIDDS